MLDPRLMLATDVVLCEDGHAQERSLLDQVLERSAPGTSGSRTATSARRTSSSGSPVAQAFFVVRQHAATLHWEFVGKRRACGRIDTGKVFEQTIRATNDAGEILILRRITVVLDKPTRDGDNRDPSADQRAGQGRPRQGDRRVVPAALDDRDRLPELEATLDGEINTLGYPKAALFAFCVALVAYNVLSTLKAALRSVHGEEVVAEEVSGYYVADEIKMTRRGMMIAIPEDEWVVFHDLTPAELAGVLVQLAEAVRLPKYRKHPRGPKKPKPEKQSGAKIKHVATAKLLAARQKCTK